jgi:hypothetical protein
MHRAPLVALALLLALPAMAKKPRKARPDDPTEQTAPMDNARLDAIIQRIGFGVQTTGYSWSFEIEGFRVMVLTDEHADRMRIVSHVADASTLTDEMRHRLLQANFDAALDARYAIARGQLWSVFLHPLSTLTPDDFLSGLAQTLTCVATYGTTFSSGALTFTGGDSQTLQDDLYQQVLEASKKRLLH